LDPSKIGLGERIAAASGLALFIFMFFPWFGVEDVDASGNAWEVLSFIDILLFLVVLVAVAVGVARATDNMPSGLPAPPDLIVAAAGAVAFLLILFRILVTPDLGGSFGGFEVEVDTTRKIGLFLGLIAAGGIAYGGYTAMNEPAAQAPAAPPPPAPPPAAT